jgi:hypothetical protein
MPAYGQAGLEKGYNAESALVKRRAVKHGATAEGVTAIAANTDIAWGVALFGVSSAELLRGKGASIRRDGIAEWEAGEAIAVSVPVTIDSVGRCVHAVAGNYVYGITEQVSTAAGDMIAVAVDFLAPVKAS